MTSSEIVTKPAEKSSAQFLSQIKLPHKQIAEPTAKNLEQMKAIGLNIDNPASPGAELID